LSAFKIQEKCVKLYQHMHRLILQNMHLVEFN